MFDLTVTAIVLLGSLGIAWSAMKAAAGRRVAHFRDVDRVAIRGASPGGWVKIVGTVVKRDRVFDAPLTGRECVGYHTIAREYEGRSWSTCIDEERLTDFFVRDETGFALVRVERRRPLSLDNEQYFSGGYGADPKDAISAFLAKHGQSPRGRVLPRTFSFRESMLEEGMTVAIIGMASHEAHTVPAADGVAFREGSQVLVLSGTAGQPLEITDDEAAR